MVEKTQFEDMLKTLRARYRASPLAAFAGWWGSELVALLPARWRRRMVAPVPRLWLLAVDEAGTLEVWRGGEQPERLDNFGAAEDPGLLRTRWHGHRRAFAEGEPEVALLLPPDLVL
ncbi:MAG: hypothetical protein ACOCVP_08525, partial [Wenzhouxiangella sp.]